MIKPEPIDISESETGLAKSVDIEPEKTDNTPGPPAPPVETARERAMSIAKPSAFSLDKFKSKHAGALAGVETLQTALPHHSISQAKDFVRLHEDETQYWSPELCFVSAD
jgi:hypothetical protein